jgi:hypothetical protein
MTPREPRGGMPVDNSASGSNNQTYGLSGMAESQRPKDSSVVEQSVSRALRDNLPLVRHTANALSHAIEDLVSACASTRPGNTLPSMLRAQTAASSLEAMLGVLLRLVTTSLQPARPSPAEALVMSHMATSAPAAVEERPAPVAEPEPQPQYLAAMESVAEPPARETIPETPYADAAASVVLGTSTEAPPEHAVHEPESYTTEPLVEPSRPAPPAMETAANEAVVVLDPSAPAEAPREERVVETPREARIEIEAPPPPSEVVPEQPAPAEPAVAAFHLESLPQGEQELHRRANRVAKVSMQDIRMLRPKDVELGQEHKDICVRLRQDIDKARKEYVRRFGPILDHPVDYFHHWMVEILAQGDPEALGEYPYPTPVSRR